MMIYTSKLSKSLSRSQKKLLDDTFLKYAKLLCASQNEFSATDLLLFIDYDDIAIRDLDLLGIETSDYYYLIVERLEAMKKRGLLKVILDPNETMYIVV